MKVLIAVDESKYADEIVSYVTAHKWKPGTEFIVLHVVDRVVAGSYVTVLPPALLEEMSKEMWARGEALVRHVAVKLRDYFHSPKIRELVLEGLAGDTIVDCAKTANVDLVILSSHRRKGMQRFLMGSVSASVSAHADCSVLVVCPPAETSSKSEAELVASSNT